MKYQGEPLIHDSYIGKGYVYAGVYSIKKTGTRYFASAGQMPRLTASVVMTGNRLDGNYRTDPSLFCCQIVLD